MRNYDIPSGFGSVFIEFYRPEDCQVVYRTLNMMMFNGKLAECSFYNLAMYEANVLHGI